MHDDNLLMLYRALSRGGRYYRSEDASWILDDDPEHDITEDFIRGVADYYWCFGVTILEAFKIGALKVLITKDLDDSDRLVGVKLEIEWPDAITLLANLDDSRAKTPPSRLSTPVTPYVPGVSIGTGGTIGGGGGTDIYGDGSGSGGWSGQGTSQVTWSDPTLNGMSNGASGVNLPDATAT